MIALGSPPDRRFAHACRRVRAGLCAASVALASPGLAAAGPVVGWRMDGTGRFPGAAPAIEWSPTKNVVWSTPMPSWSNSSPILVGGRLFVSSEPSTLVALDASDGHVLWLHANPVTQVASTPAPTASFLRASARQAEAQAELAATERRLSETRGKLRAVPGDVALAAAVRSAETGARALRDELAALALVMPPQINAETGLSAPTPASDGESVFALYGTGVAVSYALDGTRRWIRFLDQPLARDGVSASPVIVGDKVLFLVDDVIALDKASGEVAWRADVPASFGTPAPFRIAGQEFVALPSGRVVRVADGAVVAEDLGELEFASPLVQDGVLYLIDVTAKAFRIPERVPEPFELEPLWVAQVKGSRYYTSPLAVEGLLYTVTRNQFLNVVDAASGAAVYSERLALGAVGGANSVYSSPTLAGGYVFVSGFGGTTVVVKPGRSFERVAVNELEKFRSTPIFDGDRMYLRGYEHFFCIATRATTAPPRAAGADVAR